MTNEYGARKWIKLWGDEWLHGTCRFQLGPVERSIFIDLLALASRSRVGEGIIAAGTTNGEPTGYPLKMLAGMLNLDEPVLADSVGELVSQGRVERMKNHALRILGWEKYQSEYERQSVYRKKWKEERASRANARADAQESSQPGEGSGSSEASYKQVTPQVTDRLPTEAEAETEDRREKTACSALPPARSETDPTGGIEGRKACRQSSSPTATDSAQPAQPQDLASVDSTGLARSVLSVIEPDRGGQEEAVARLVPALNEPPLRKSICDALRSPSLVLKLKKMDYPASALIEAASSGYLKRWVKKAQADDKRHKLAPRDLPAPPKPAAPPENDYMGVLRKATHAGCAPVDDSLSDIVEEL